MAEALPTEIHGATITTGPARFVVDEPLLDLTWEEPDLSVVSSRTQTACRFPGGGHFWITDGERVVVERCDEDRPAAYLHGTVGAFVLAQQGRFALHANVVDVNGSAIALCGQRRAGKSTTSLALSQRGHRLITDDVAALDVDGQVVVHRPAGRPIHIRPETAERLGVSIAGGVPVASDPGKLALANPASAPVEVGAIVLLRAVAQGCTGVQLRRLGTDEATGAAHRHVYRNELLGSVWPAEMFAWAAAVASRISVWLLVRPADDWTIEDVCTAIEGLVLDLEPARSDPAQWAQHTR